MTEQELKAALMIKRKLERREASLDNLRATGGLRSGLSSSGTGRSRAGEVGQLTAELEEETRELRKKLEIEQEIIRRALEKADLGETERKLMVMRYVECKSWSYVRKVLGYADRQTYRIHDKAKKLAVDGSP